MNTIKFSHDYEKLPENPDGKIVTLLRVEVVFLEDILDSFLEYDTKYRGKDGHYPLPKKGKFLCLTFIDYQTLREFTTLRRWEKKKSDYYFSKQNQEFEIVIDDGTRGQTVSRFLRVIHR